MRLTPAMVSKSANRPRDVGGDLDDIRADRSLLLPGPYPPLSHLGATLLRYCVHSALRFSLYQLGQPLPESPPTRFVALRLYLDTPSLRSCLSSPGSEEILRALVHPSGAALEPLPMRLRGILGFHRARLRARSALRLTTRSAKAATSTNTTESPSRRLSGLLPALHDAFLGELIAVLDRRQRRAAGQEVGPVQSFEAARYVAGSRARLSFLGPPDPRQSSWLGSQPPQLEDSADGVPRLPSHRSRGGFREHYRRLLDLLRPSLLGLGERAVDRGHLASLDDLFFLPLDLIEDLEAEKKPEWLDGAVQANRAEWQEMSERNAPADTLGNVAPVPVPELSAELSPLWPLV